MADPTTHCRVRDRLADVDPLVYLILLVLALGVAAAAAPQLLIDAIIGPALDRAGMIRV